MDYKSQQSLIHMLLFHTVTSVTVTCQDWPYAEWNFLLCSKYAAYWTTSRSFSLFINLDKTKIQQILSIAKQYPVVTKDEKHQRFFNQTNVLPLSLHGPFMEVKLGQAKDAVLDQFTLKVLFYKNANGISWSVSDSSEIRFFFVVVCVCLVRWQRVIVFRCLFDHQLQHPSFLSGARFH